MITESSGTGRSSLLYLSLMKLLRLIVIRDDTGSDFKPCYRAVSSPIVPFSVPKTKEQLQEHLCAIKPSDSSDKPLMSMIIRKLAPVFARHFAVYTAVIVPLRCSKVAEARGQLQGGPNAPPRSQGATRGLFASTALRRNRPLLQELTWTDW